MAQSKMSSLLLLFSLLASFALSLSFLWPSQCACHPHHRSISPQSQEIASFFILQSRNQSQLPFAIYWHHQHSTTLLGRHCIFLYCNRMIVTGLWHLHWVNLYLKTDRKRKLLRNDRFATPSGHFFPYVSSFFTKLRFRRSVWDA